MIDCKDYVITHKECDVPEDDMYRILCVGNYRQDGCLSELDGINMSEYNSRINECTGLYWIWKNTRSDYVGLSHYRRWFYNCRWVHDRSRLDADRAEELLKDHDIILTDRSVFRWRVIDNCNIELGEEITQQADLAFRTVIAEKQPDYLEAYDKVQQGHGFYAYGIFVTRREILNAYCEWLFSFLLDATDRIDVSECSAKQQRIAGYFAETMWTVWLEKNPLRVCELPHRFVKGGSK